MLEGEKLARALAELVVEGGGWRVTGAEGSSSGATIKDVRGGGGGGGARAAL